MNSDTSDSSPMRNIVLIGFMGCGKSTIGRELTKSLGYKLIDTDHLIEKQTGRSIPEIFKSDGEAAFRELETALLQEMLAKKITSHIISTGGGMAVSPINQKLLKQLGFVVWLSCSPNDIHARTAHTSHRPLLECDDPMAVITRLLNERAPHYKKSAHLKIDTSELNIPEISCGILESARYHFSTADEDNKG